MKNLINTIILSIVSITAFAQTSPATGQLLYGPVPYRTPEQTIGEYYVVAPPSIKDEKNIIELHYENTTKHVPYTETDGKKIKLTEIKDKTGHFASEDGKIYTCKLIDDVSFLGIYPLKELEMSRAMFLNKTLWIKNNGAFVYHIAEDKYVDTTVNRFRPVTIIDVALGRFVDMPLVFTFKTANGKTACFGIDVSGTNTYRQPQYFLEENFYLKDPHLIYHFTPTVWKQIESGDTPIGMSTEAFELAKGRPTKKNFSQTGNTYYQQWVYGENSPRYYYFTNGKYTGYN